MRPAHIRSFMLVTCLLISAVAWAQPTPAVAPTPVVTQVVVPAPTPTPVLSPVAAPATTVTVVPAVEAVPANPPAKAAEPIPTPTPTPLAPTFVGCFTWAPICLAWQGALSLVEYNLSTGKFGETFDPSIGYGPVFFPNSWYALTLGGYLTAAIGQQGVPNRVKPSIILGLPGGVHFGVGLPITEQSSGPALTQVTFMFGFAGQISLGSAK
jgi:hypothetical protein